MVLLKRILQELNVLLVAVFVVAYSFSVSHMVLSLRFFAVVFNFGDLQFTFFSKHMVANATSFWKILPLVFSHRRGT